MGKILAAGTEPVVLIAMERGSVWPTWARRGVPAAIVLAEQPGEDAIAFARRVARRVARLHTTRQRLGRAVIAVADRRSRQALVARWLMVQAVISAAGERSSADVVVSVPETVGEELRHELFALAGAMCEHLDASRCLRIRFERFAPASADGFAPALAAAMP